MDARHVGAGVGGNRQQVFDVATGKATPLTARGEEFVKRYAPRTRDGYLHNLKTLKKFLVAHNLPATRSC